MKMNLNEKADPFQNANLIDFDEILIKLHVRL